MHRGTSRPRPPPAPAPQLPGGTSQRPGGTLNGSAAGAVDSGDRDGQPAGRRRPDPAAPRRVRASHPVWRRTSPARPGRGRHRGRRAGRGPRPRRRRAARSPEPSRRTTGTSAAVLRRGVRWPSSSSAWAGGRAPSVRPPRRQRGSGARRSRPHGPPRAADEPAAARAGDRGERGARPVGRRGPTRTRAARGRRRQRAGAAAGPPDVSRPAPAAVTTAAPSGPPTTMASRPSAARAASAPRRPRPRRARTDAPPDGNRWATARMSSASVTTSPSKPSRSRSWPVMTLRDNDAGMPRSIARTSM